MPSPLLVVGFSNNFLYSPYPSRVQFLVGNEPQRGGVDAIAQTPCFGGPVVEDVTQVAVAVGRPHLRPDHAETSVHLLDDVVGRYGFSETGPAAAAVVLLGRREERFARDDVDVETRLLVVPELIVEGRLGGAVLRNLELTGFQLRDGLRILSVRASGHVVLLCQSGSACIHTLMAARRSRSTDQAADARAPAGASVVDGRAGPPRASSGSTDPGAPRRICRRALLALVAEAVDPEAVPSVYYVS